ncbi:bifunctional 2',3'-cyclic-nucleotide 2'-phosphodiesterase/3'-nucleotidase [Paracoccus nototheniae]|uniref:Bifunctional 2',3'-cyclic-nucleotide 2'-phosphodiesterase/3'-nucleotidase n=1 Tax=Paracoccus nototheniae TaxID=2489002 RepID=A0ABW4E3K2_9RHOB|nr:bifunctional 2',3'-cyclic-nucleotide 2'-phosphodiesterase/3'-nucleotidase [Paracoccus nototheniae]
MAEHRSAIAPPVGPHRPGTAPSGMTLRILATTDLHMHLMPHDYLADRPSALPGLARAATLIEAHRAEAGACLLLDNGDFLQGSPMGEVIARQADAARAIHPAIAAMNALNYDAAALGNHDFNFGLTFLRRSVARARFPMLAANLALQRGPDFPAWCVIRRRLTDSAGHHHDLRIGVIGFLPPQTGEWDPGLRPMLHSGDIIASARRLLPGLRATGVDLVVALAHSGIGAAEPAPRMEHAALALAGLAGIDVVIAGHSHQVFPGPGWQDRPGIDAGAGTLAGKPAVMPGFGGSHLGVIDLRFCAGVTGALHLDGFAARVEPVPVDIPASDLVQRPVAAAHRATRRQMAIRVGRSGQDLNSHYAVIGLDAGLRLVNLAQRWHVRRLLAGTPHAGLPVLSATAPHRAGGRGGTQHFTDVPAGPLNQRHLSDLYPFPNWIAAIRIRGAQLRGWLERSASMFRQIPPGARDADLLDPDFPTYNFDVIDGITWQVDLSRPARFDPDGCLIRPQAWRIHQLRWQGRPVGDDDPFVLATNSYRLSGCGLFGPLVSQNDMLLGPGTLTRDVLRRYVRERRHILMAGQPNWGFLPQPGSTALFRTAPAALDRPLPDQVQAVGHDADGFAVMRLIL